jgi:hypothetical protein
LIIQQCWCLVLVMSQVCSVILNWLLAVSTSICSPRDGRVPVKGSIVTFLTELGRRTAGELIICRARAGPGISAVTILSRQNILNTAHRANRHILKYLC